MSDFKLLHTLRMMAATQGTHSGEGAGGREAGGRLAELAADRIEELEAENAALRKTIEEAGFYYDPEIDCATKGEWAARAKAAETKLAKAVEALGDLADCVDDGCFCSEVRMAATMDHALTTLAELTGGNDE